MEKVATKPKGILDFNIESFPTNEIELLSKTDNEKNYMAAHICGKYYSADSLLSNEELTEDIRSLILVYNQHSTLMGWRNNDQFIDYLLTIEEVEDTQFQSDIQLANGVNTLRRPISVPLQPDNGKGMAQLQKKPS